MPRLIDRAHTAGVRTALVTDRAVRALSDTVTPPGLVAVCDLLDVPLARRGATRNPSARGSGRGRRAGQRGNASSGSRTRWARTRRSSRATVSTRTTANASGHPRAASSTFRWCESGTPPRYSTASARPVFRLLATAADGEVDLDDADELLARPTAWLFGNEAHGLDPAIAARADHRVRIPIHGRAESLNLATAACDLPVRERADPESQANRQLKRRKSDRIRFDGELFRFRREC